MISRETPDHPPQLHNSFIILGRTDKRTCLSPPPHEGKCRMRLVSLSTLRPNNWFINRAKLQSVREAWRRGEQEHLPPVLVAEIEGELSLIDGHSRAFVAYERGETHIWALALKLEQIEGSQALYRHIHREGPRNGVETIADLSVRIVGPEDHQRLWVGYCTRWLEENPEATIDYWA